MRKSRMGPVDSGAPNRSRRSAFQGRLLNGNPSGDLTKAPRCGAKTRRNSSCQAPAMRNPQGGTHGARIMGRLDRTPNPGRVGTIPACQVEGRALLRKEEGMAATVPGLHSAISRRTARDPGANSRRSLRPPSSGHGGEESPPARRVSIPDATLQRAPLASIRHVAVYRVHPRFSRSCTRGAHTERCSVD